MNERAYLEQVDLRRDDVPNFSKYPFNIPAVKSLETLTLHPQVTFFVGENGSGKSTLLEAIAQAIGFGAEGGPTSIQFQSPDTTSGLHKFLLLRRSYLTPKDRYFLRAETMFNIASYMDELGRQDPRYLEQFNYQPLHSRSHGELFIDVLTLKLRGRGLYLFDEPESALSPNRQLVALAALHGLVQNDSQFIIATHSPILLAYPHAKIIHFSSSGMQEVAYEETEHFQVTRDFLNGYQRMLKHLLAEE